MLIIIIHSTQVWYEHIHICISIYYMFRPVAAIIECVSPQDNPSLYLLYFTTCCEEVVQVCLLRLKGQVNKQTNKLRGP
jgi:hypothetical protein